MTTEVYAEDRYDDEARETCSRCHGRRVIPLRLDDWEVDDEPCWGETTCPRCGGTGYERDPEEIAEMRYFYGPDWEEV